MHLVDDCALIWLCGEDEEGNDVVPKGLLETENPHVVSWAESFYEEYLLGGEAVIRRTDFDVGFLIGFFSPFVFGIILPLTE